MQSVTVIVVSHNSQPYLEGCLASIVEGQGIPADIVVVDNASTDGSAALVVARFPAAQLTVNPDNRGFAAAVNQGLALAMGEFVLLLNPDATLLPGTLAQLVGFLETHPCAAAVGPRQWLDADCTWQWSIVPWPPHWRIILSGLPGLRRLGLARRQPAAHWALNRAIWRDEEPRDVAYLSGACLLLRRAALEAVGGLDERYFLFFEDVDLCQRLSASGWTLHAVPSAGIVHAVQGSARALADAVLGHLLASGSLYLARFGDPLTRALWAVLRLRRTHRSRQLDRTIGQASPSETLFTLRFPSTPGAVAYWVELAPDPTFLYAVATQLAQPACTLPVGLLALTRGRHFFWRVAAVDASGQTGPFSRPQRGLAGFPAIATSSRQDQRDLL